MGIVCIHTAVAGSLTTSLCRGFALLSFPSLSFIASFSLGTLLSFFVPATLGAAVSSAAHVASTGLYIDSTTVAIMVVTASSSRGRGVWSTAW